MDQHLLPSHDAGADRWIGEHIPDLNATRGIGGKPQQARTIAQRSAEEAEASEIWEYANEFVPGLLQTADYCRAITVANRPDITKDDLARMVDLRKARQELLESCEPHLAEQALHHALALFLGALAELRTEADVRLQQPVAAALTRTMQEQNRGPRRLGGVVGWYVDLIVIRLTTHGDVAIEKPGLHLQRSDEPEQREKHDALQGQES